MLAVLVLLSLWASTEAVGAARSRPRPQRRRPKKPKVDLADVTPPPAQNIDIERVRNQRHGQSLTLCAHMCFILRIRAFLDEATEPESLDCIWFGKRFDEKDLVEKSS